MKKDEKVISMVSFVRKTFRIMAIMIVLLCAISFSPDHVCANQVLTKQNFDYTWYLAKHPDLAAAIPANDKDAIWSFYQTTGEPNGWYGRASMASYITASNMDYDTFLAQNQDVYALYGNNHKKVYNWYKKTGVKENRPVQTTNKEINVKLKMYTMAGTIFNDAMSDREIIKAVHDWIINNTSYDIQNLNAGTLPPESFNIIGVINNKKGVCQGYAETFETFMNIAGIECELLQGNATNSTGSAGGHAWNRVKVDGNWLYIDVTWDDPISSSGENILRYDYFLISEQQMNTNHTPAIYQVQ